MPDPMALDGTRAQVLTAIRTAPAPVTVEELARELGLHPNSVRFHTAALEDEGLVRRDPQATGRKGRPRSAFRPTAAGFRSGQRSYLALASVLISQLDARSGDPTSAARDAGRAWGEHLAADLGPGRGDRVQAAVDVLDDLGFEPVPGRDEIHLHNCPFRELVDAHQDVVCAIHHGLLDGVVNGAGDPVVTVDLKPFATPTTCLVELGEDGR